MQSIICFSILVKSDTPDKQMNLGLGLSVDEHCIPVPFLAQVILNQIDKTLVMAATSQASAERISTLQDAFCGMLSTAITKLLSQEDSKGALLPLADKVRYACGDALCMNAVTA